MSTMHLSRRLRRMIELGGEEVEVMPVGPLMVDSSRENQTTRKPATIRLAIPDKDVLAMRGRRSDVDEYFLVRVPQSVVKGSASRLVLPGD